MNGRRSIVGALSVAVLVAGSSLLAQPAGAATSCTAGMSPKVPIGYSSLKVGCVIDISPTPANNPSGLEIHDATNAAWHRGAARNAGVATTLNSTAITYVAGVLTAADVRRPIS